MQNVNMVVKGNKLMVEVDATKRLYESQSGKSIVVATTAGNVEIPNAPGIKMGLNVYVPTKQGTAAVVRDVQNAKITHKAGKLTIEVDITKDFGASSSGKSMIVASTGGNTAVEGLPEIRVGLNIYKPIKAGTPVQQTLV